MKDKMLRLPFENAAAYASDCVRHAYAALAALDRDVAAGGVSTLREQLEALVVHVDRVIEELDAIRKRLVDLRYSPAVTERISSAAERDLQELDKLERALQGFVPRAALFLRVDEVRGSLPNQLMDPSTIRAAVFSVVRELREAAERGRDGPTAPAVFDAIAAIESLHDGTSVDEAKATERKRWE